MQFRTAIDIAKTTLPPLNHSDNVLLIGSCFSDNMGLRLQNAMIDAVVNPFGTTYNPLSLLKCIEWIASKHSVEANELFENEGLWHHFMFHSRFSGVDIDGTVEAMNASIKRGHEQLMRCSHLFVTLGTSIVYRLYDSDTVVNNCHKLPSSRFSRRLCSIQEVGDAVMQIARAVNEVNPKAHIIFTVSPIRHLADGLAMNHLSKSLLTVAAHNAVAAYPGCCHYFPAYEILNDDLRDYRFYAADMAHPSDIAIDYVWEQFKTAFFASAERQKVEQCERLSRMLSHRPVNPNPAVVEQFRQKVLQSAAAALRQYPYIAKLDYLKPYITQ